MKKNYDVAIVGAGIVGLAMALAAVKRGKKVAVFERSPRASGASVRNFGLVWPLGQPVGPQLDMALKSREIWLDLADKARISVQQNGSLTLAYHPTEQAVLEEFADSAMGNGYDCQLVTTAEIARFSSATKTEGLKAGLWSRTECTVSSRLAIPQLASYLEHAFGVDFYWNTAICSAEAGALAAFDKSWGAERIYICNGQDFETLYPSIFAASGITRCKLQMMRTATQPDAWKLGPSLCAGLTLLHYGNFANCPSLGDVKTHYDQLNPNYGKWGIHVLLSQNALGELIIGDSHEYGLDVSPFDSAAINREILTYLSTFANFPDQQIVEQWHGVYAKNPASTPFVKEVETGVWIVNGLGGAGMTLSFGLAESII